LAVIANPNGKAPEDPMEETASSHWTVLSPAERYRLCVMRLCEYSFVRGRRPDPEQLEELLIALAVPLVNLEREVAASFATELSDTDPLPPLE
jgi:hypothetical protein